MKVLPLPRAKALSPTLPLRWLVLAWLAQLLLGVAMARLQPIPERPLVIERSACSTAQWQRLLEKIGRAHV